MNNECDNEYGNERSGFRGSASGATRNGWSGARLRLVVSRRTAGVASRAVVATRLRVVPAATSLISLPQGSYDIRFASSRRSGASKQESRPAEQNRGASPCATWKESS